ncbi:MULTISPECIES: nuclear transport factor 2 family protein [Subtercola]|uniref:Nuclear transport factor 2 family protein n=1 Tax=Subtercola vilae TaxID=2056433 RepID=A0A4T2C2X5_9MICO|nr:MULTISPECIES: nuclear transport factor 2 family protein [Subtercola]MEA9984140.1 nuclear transport factor 2 family protein [Subtercola sp. RTI3]TIH38645.1 nuclear transport factor 2 family protein [Subtercola vilae]
MSIDAEITTLEQRRFAAMLEGDTEALRGLFHDDLGYGHSNGTRETKESLLAKISDGVLDYARIDHPISEILLSGDTAVVVGAMSASVRIAGNAVELNSSTISVWVRSGEAWQLLAFQPTPVAAAV